MNKSSRIALLFTIAVLGVSITSSPALAHNELLDTSPASGATVQAGLIPITLHFEESPLDLGPNQGNLIAVADSATGEQLGPACALISGSDLSATIDIAKAGEYKILWRSTADDGHVASGDFLITVENTTQYQTEDPGNRCYDENGARIMLSDQVPLSTKKTSALDPIQGLLIGIGFIVLGSVASAFVIRRRQRKSSNDYK